ncbi:MAG: DUF2277 domain-containing protein [Anaerolineae bacterium]|nr:MAG: DUF2277 domain-containing protein [Anaerolineae bacterium]
MCRNIKKLRNTLSSPTDEEIALASLQFVRKVSGYQRPSRVNQNAFDTAVAEIALATRRLFDHLEGPSPDKLSDD